MKVRATGQSTLALDDAAIRAQDQLRLALLRRQRGWRRLLLALALVGPGILVMIADNDAGGVITYAQTGAGYGLGFYLPFLVLLGPVAYLVQEMTVRLGAVTGRGHAEMIWGRYGPFWGSFSLVDLVVANGLTLVTEFIGITVGLAVFGVPPLASAAGGVALIAAVMLGLRYYTWERVALAIAAGNLVFLPLVALAPPHWDAVARAFAQWTIPGGVTPAFLYLVLANLGTTIAPWMLFFQQSSVVDKGLTPRDIRAGQVDTALGVAGMVLVALAIVVLTGTWVHGLPHAGGMSVQQLLQALGRRVGPWGERLFALGLVEAGVIAAIAVTASTSWATGEALNWPRSLNLPARRAWRFYLPGLASAAVAAWIVLIPHAPLGFLNLTVQVVATIFMPAAMLFLLLLLNDREIMGRHVNRPWQNWAAGSIVGALVLINAAYGWTVVFPPGR
ncbi:MAG: divalent metal cation transporter [Thermaerobacter sp.]|nr:divalent metal cation transporter [Thermaerobacter sp.]